MEGPRLSGEQLVEMYRKMVRIRKFEMKVNDLFLKGLIPGTIHLSHGQEAVAVGVCASLQNHDKIVPTHRPHGHALAQGIDPKRLMAEILGKAQGCCRGKGGSMHIADIESGIMPSLPIVGAGIPIAAGIAFAMKSMGRDNVAVSFFGDGATNIGAFHEGLNLAAIMKLPVIFVCENNLYAVTTSIRKTSLLENLSDKARSYGIPGLSVDGNDVEKVYYAASDAVQRARAGEGPTMIECKTYRQGGHSRTDAGTYRPKGELEEWLKRDPLILFRNSLVERQLITDERCDRLESGETELIEGAAAFAVAGSEPIPDNALDDVYSNTDGS